MVYLTMMSCKKNTEQVHDNHDHEHEAVIPENAHDEENSEEHDHENETESGEHKEHEHDYKTGLIKAESFHQIIKTSGKIESSPSDEIAVVASNSGIIKFANGVAEGAIVSFEQILFHISGDNVVDNNIALRYNTAKADFEKAKSDFDRAEQLIKKKIISEKEYQQIKLEYSNTKYEYDLIAKSYSKGSGTITSPVKGFIKEYFVEEGQYVETGQRIAVINSQDKLRLIAEVSQKDIQNLSEIESANFYLNNSEKVFDTKALNGKLLSYGKSINSNSFFIPVVFEISYHKELLPGSFAQIFLKGNEQKDVIVIPESALIEDQDNYFVFVEEEHDKFQKRHVVLGASDGENILVLEGLSAGEIIVTEGTYFVKLASMSNELPVHSHSH